MPNCRINTVLCSFELFSLTLFQFSAFVCELFMILDNKTLRARVESDGSDRYRTLYLRLFGKLTCNKNKLKPLKPFALKKESF